MHIFKLKKNFHNFLKNKKNKKTTEFFFKKLNNKNESLGGVFLLNTDFKNNIEWKKFKLVDRSNNKNYLFLKKKIIRLRRFLFFKKRSVFVRNFSSFFFFFHYHTKNLNNYKSTKLFLSKFKNKFKNKNKFKKILTFISKIHRFKGTEADFFFKNFKEVEVRKKIKFKNKYERKYKYKRNGKTFYHSFRPKNFRYKYQFSRFFKIKKKYKNKLKLFKLSTTHVNLKYLKSSLFLENNSDIQNMSFFFFKKNFYSFIDSVFSRRMFLFKNFYFFYLFNKKNKKTNFLFVENNKNIVLSFLKNYNLFISKKNINELFFLDFFFQTNFYNTMVTYQNQNKFFFNLKTNINKNLMLTDFMEEFDDNIFFFNLLSSPNFFKITTAFDKFKKFDDFFVFYYKRSIATFRFDEFFSYSNTIKKTINNKKLLTVDYFFSKLSSSSLFRLKNYNTFFKIFSFFVTKKKKIFFRKLQNFYYQESNNKKRKKFNKKTFFFQNFSFHEIISSSKTYLNNQILNFNKFFSLNFTDLVFFFNNPLFFKSYNFSKKNQSFKNTDYLSIYNSLLKKNIKNTWTNLYIDPSIFSVDVARQLSFASDYKKIKSFFAYLPYETLIKFIEYCSGKRAVVKIDPFLLKSIQAEDSTRCFLWSHRVKFFRKNLGPRLFLVESLQILTLCLRLRDPYVLSNWMLSMFYKISFWKYKGLLRYLQYVLRYFFWPYFPDYKVKGLRFQLKGKVSVAGNARTRTVVSQIGALSHSTYRYKVLTNLNLLRTFTGVIGFKTWMVF